MRIIGLAGWSGAGKTTLLDRLIPVLTGRGLLVSTMKHAHHKFDLDHPGTDTWAWRAAGANQILVASDDRWTLLQELDGAAEPSLPALVARLAPVDLVLIEGFKRWSHPKIEIYRAANGKPLQHPDDPAIVGIAADIALPDLTIPWCHLDDTEGIADMVLTRAAPADSVSWSETPGDRR